MTGELLDCFQRVTRLAVDLEMCPRWRWRKRRELEARYAEACEAADRARARVGVTPGAPPIRQIIKEAQQ